MMVIGGAGPLTINSLDLLAKRAAVRGWRAPGSGMTIARIFDMTALRWRTCKVAKERLQAKLGASANRHD
jgi:hypothetical protein